MTVLLSAAVVVLAANLLAGLVRVVLGPKPADRMLGALLLSSTVVALLVLLAEMLAIDALRQVALLLVLLAAITSVAFVGLAGADEDIE